MSGGAWVVEWVKGMLHDGRVPVMLKPCTYICYFGHTRFLTVTIIINISVEPDQKGPFLFKDPWALTYPDCQYGRSDHNCTCF